MRLLTGDTLTDRVEVEYRGPATLGGSGRARLHDRVGGIAEMLWEALDGAGWVGETVSLRTTVSLRVGVTAVAAERPEQRARLEPLPGRVRRPGEKGRVDDQGVAWQQSVGPLNGRAAGPGYRLLESERRPEDLEFGEDLLYAAAVRAGWLGREPGEVAEVPDVQISIGVARRNPRWEAFAASEASAGRPRSRPAHLTQAGPADEDASPRQAETFGAIDERQLLTMALSVAARAGDPNPELIQHARGSRFDVTGTTGSVVFSDAPSYIVVMKGNFGAPGPHRPIHPVTCDESVVAYPFQIIVIDAETGQITDSGSSSQSPDLRPLGEVVTFRDRRA